MNGDDNGLKTIDRDGSVPVSRMTNPVQASARIQTMFNSEKRGRAQRRALVKGLVDGNPPYRPSDMKRAGRASSCNVNWRIAEFYLNMSRYAFYEVFNETPTYARVEIEYGSPAQQREWSRIAEPAFDKLIRKDKSWDRVNQFSIFDMVLYGCGPLIFNDETDWRNEFVSCQNLILPDFTSSDVEKWEEACIVRSYLPTELYQCIKNEKEARESGWDIEQTRKAIMNASQITHMGGQYKDWEWHQQELKNNSYWYDAQSKVIQTVHYYFREFPKNGEDNGRITHSVLINPEDAQNELQAFLFKKVGRFGSWTEIIHPMYYDNDGGGYHHSVTGLGVKMYSAMEYQNRLLCNLADKTFAPKILLKALNANSNEQLNIVQFADFGKIPSGLDVVQTPIGSYMDEGMAFNRELSSMIASNLSQYRANLSKESGNPITAYEAQVRVSEQSKLGKTQLVHNYNQRDWLYAEKFRRAINPEYTGFMPGGREAVEFRTECLEAGIPMVALRKAKVKATRTVGQGSQFMRQQALQSLFAVYPMMSSDTGKANLMEDYIAAVAGQDMVDRYVPRYEMPDKVDQVSMATLQVSAAKDGVAPVVGGSQDSLVFAGVFIKSLNDAVASLQQGGNPQGVYMFIGTMLPALEQHAARVAQNPTQKKEAKGIAQQARMFIQIYNKLGPQIQQMNQQAQKQQKKRLQRQQQLMTDQQMDQIELQSKIRQSQQKTDAMLEMKREKANQSLVLADAQTASKIQRANVETASKLNQQRKNGEE